MQMDAQFSISIYLDTRREKANGKYPVKLRVYSHAIQKTKLYPTVFEYTKKEFESIWTDKPRVVNRPLKIELQAIESKAVETAKSLTPFSFEQFEKKLYRVKGDGSNVLYHYDQLILKLRENKQFGTASNYEMSKRSLVEFAQTATNKKPSKILFSEITKDWLTRYENFMLKDLGRSRTTVSMYLRALRTIFNNAIQDREIDLSIYPFGEKKYQIPAVKKVKKALNAEQLRTLFNAVPATPEQQEAKDFWFFSFACNGMNIKDIALLRWENLDNDTLNFYRAKTINTGKKDLTPVKVYLTDFAKQVIEKYGTDKNNKKQTIFPILDLSVSEFKQFTAVKNFTRFINQNFRKFAKSNGVDVAVSTYWARHSFATSAIRKGASMEFVSEALNHSDLKTTQNYFAGFAEESKRELMNTIMEF
jgi:integrase/recombinase XerD